MIGVVIRQLLSDDSMHEKWYAARNWKRRNSRIPTLFKNFIFYIFLSIFCTGVFHPLLAQTDSLQYQPQKKDSTDYYRSKNSGKKGWEHIVSLPGTILSIPFITLFKVQEALIAYVYSSKMIPKIKSIAVSDDGLRGIVPKFSNRKGYGVKVYQEQILSKTDDLSFTATGNVFRGRERYRVRWRNIQLLGSPFYLNVLGRYRNLPNESFFGIGPDTEKSNRTFFTQENTALLAGLDFRTSPSFAINTVFRVDYDNAYGGDEEPSVKQIYNEETLPGLQSRVRIAQVKVGFTLDTRNREGNPSTGRELMMAGTIFRDIENGPFNFWKFQGDYRHYIDFGRNRVLALRFGFEMTDIFEGGDQIPFYYLSELGVSTSIRGYARGRFRDFDMALGSIEYRIPIWRSIDFTAFTDAGQVANNLLEDFRLRKLRLGFGAGLRLHGPNKLVANVQAAISREKFRFILDIN